MIVILLHEALNCSLISGMHANTMRLQHCICAAQMHYSHSEQQQWIQRCTTYRSQHENAKCWLEKKRPEGVPRIQKFLQQTDSCGTRPCQHTPRLAAQIMQSTEKDQTTGPILAAMKPIMALGVTRHSSFIEKKMRDLRSSSSCPFLQLQLQAMPRRHR